MFVIICVLLIWHGVLGLLELSNEYMFPNNRKIAYFLYAIVGFSFIYYLDKINVLVCEKEK